MMLLAANKRMKEHEEFDIYKGQHVVIFRDSPAVVKVRKNGLLFFKCESIFPCFSEV